MHTGSGQDTYLEAELDFGTTWDAPPRGGGGTTPAFVVQVSTALTSNGNLGITISSFDGAASVCKPSKPCKNSGLPALDGGNCVCDCANTGYTGSACNSPEKCDQITEGLASELDGIDFCQNGGTALGDYGACSCDCDGTGFGGAACDQCIPSKPCLNGGVTQWRPPTSDQPGVCACNCAVGYKGDNCQTPIACKCVDNICPVAANMT